MLWLLLKNKLNMSLNSFLKDNTSRKRRKIFALVGGAILFYFMFQWTFEIFNILMLNYDQGLQLINNMLSLFFFGFFILLFASGVIIAIHYLFISTDLPLLMSAPLSSTTIFSYKLIESIFANSSLFLFLGVPIFISYGIAIHAPFSYYPLMLINTLTFLALPVSISFLIALLIIRIIPAIKAREIMVAILGVIFLLIWIALQLFRVSQFDNKSSDFNPERIEHINHLTQHTLFNFLPSTWAAKSLIAFSSVDWLLIFSKFIPLLMSTGLIFLVCLLIAKSLFNEGVFGSQFETNVRRKSQRSKKAKLLSFHRPKFSSVIGMILLRDFKLFIRDIRLSTNILILVAMMILFPLIQGREQVSGNYIPFILITIFSAFVSVQTTSRLIPFEGKSFWIMMLLPQSWSKILIGKFFVGYIFNLLSVWIAVLVSCIYFHPPPRIIALSFILTMLINFSISVYGLTIGSLFPKFDWDHPKRMLTTGGGLILNFGALVYASIWVGLMALIYTLGSLLNQTTFLLDIIVIIVSLIIATITSLIGLIISSKKMNRLDWIL